MPLRRHRHGRPPATRWLSGHEKRTSITHFVQRCTIAPRSLEGDGARWGITGTAAMTVAAPPGWIGLFLAMLLWSGPAFADTFRCADGIADIGNTPAQVMEKCGPPTQRDRWRTPAGTQQQWLYNAGPERLLTTVMFLNGRVSIIRASGFGFDPELRDPAGCRRGLFQIGEPRASVLARCGEPEVRQGGGRLTRAGQLPLAVTERFDYRTATQIHEIHFENGRITRINSRFR